VDDLDMKITHILRGHDWLPSTPIHLLVFEYLGGTRPEIGHLTDILSSETGKKLSKRRDSVFVEQFLKEGYLPEALLNFIMLLGWAPKDNREVFTLEEFVKEFDTKGFQESNPKFFMNKLDWFNQQYIQKLEIENLKLKIIEFFGNKYSPDIVHKIVPLINTRIRTLKEFENIAGFFFETPDVDIKMLGESYREHLDKAREVIENLSDWNLKELSDGLMKVVKDNSYHTGKFFMDLRIAITGNKSTPPIADSIIILGKEEAIKRLRNVLPS
jgi:glutamyl/glutaminyl-tRNA synthetase